MKLKHAFAVWQNFGPRFVCRAPNRLLFGLVGELVSRHAADVRDRIVLSLIRAHGGVFDIRDFRTMVH